jgi:aromatic-L-amino-acid decarboxylase
VQMSRSARAIKVWLSLSYFGVAAFREAIDRCLDLALEAERLITASAELELMSPAQLGVVCFRRSGPAGESEDEAARRNTALVRAFEAAGEGLVSSTRLDGRYAIRLIVMNHTTTAADVARTVDWFRAAPARFR